MRASRFVVTYVLMLVLQLVLTRHGQVAPYLYVCLLPAMILCIPTALPTWAAMLAAFASGMLVDGLADGPLGLNTMALVAVAFTRRSAIGLLIDSELIERNYNFSFYRNGWQKISLALIAEIVLFFAIYVIADSAGTRSVGFNAMRILISSTVSYIFSLAVVATLSPRIRQ